jgi:DNA modification methylase
MHKQQTLFPELGTTTYAHRRKREVTPERLPTNTTTDSHPVHRWFNFIAGFSPEFVELSCRHTIQRGKGGLLLDPFAGCGTALVTAAILGLDAIGYEAHPIFETISKAKLPNSNVLGRLAKIEEAILSGLRKPAPVSILGAIPLAFLAKLFPEDTLAQLVGAREELSGCGLADNPLAFLILSKTLDLCSHSATDGIYKAPSTKKQSWDPASAVTQTCGMMRADLSIVADRAFGRRARILGKSSEVMSEVPDGSVDIVVTSPPYLNNFDFAEMTRMYLYFWGWASSWGEITEKVRSRLVVNTTTALKGHKQLQEAYRQELSEKIRPALDVMVKALAEKRGQKAGKKEYDFLIYPYFAQMARVLRECKRAMRPGAQIHIMVADSALYGIHVQTPILLAELLDVIGFSEVRCTLVRKRGHRWVLDKREGAKDGLGEYHVLATRGGA